MKERRHRRDAKNEYESCGRHSESQEQSFRRRRSSTLSARGLALLINREPDLIVCGAAEDAQSAFRAMPDRAPGRDGRRHLVDRARRPRSGENIRTRYPHLPVLVLSMHDEAIYAERALRAGAKGYIMKQEATEKVLVALRRILRGDVYLSDRVSGKMLQQYVRGSTHRAESPVADLSDRELEVFRLVGEGHGTRQIAEELHLSVKTVETYQAHIKEIPRYVTLASSCSMQLNGI